MTIGERIKEYRLQKNWSQQELASQLHVSRQAVSRWELGSSVPDIEILVKLSDIFSIDLEQLISGEIIEVQLRDSISANKKLKKLYFVLVPMTLIIFCFLLTLAIRNTKEENTQREQIKLSQLSQDLDTLTYDFNTLLRNKYILLPYRTVEQYELDALASRSENLSESLEKLNKNMLNVEDSTSLSQRINHIQHRIHTVKEYLEVYQIIQEYYDVDFLNDKGEFNRSLRSKSVPDLEELEKVERKVLSLPDGMVKNEFEKTVDRLKNPYVEEDDIIIID